MIVDDHSPLTLSHASLQGERVTQPEIPAGCGHAHRSTSPSH